MTFLGRLEGRRKEEKGKFFLFLFSVGILEGANFRLNWWELETVGVGRGAWAMVGRIWWFLGRGGPCVALRGRGRVFTRGHCACRGAAYMARYFDVYGRDGVGVVYGMG